MTDRDNTVTEELLARFVPMSALGAASLRELAQHAELITLAPGDTLAEELSGTESTYYVVDGTLFLTGGGLADDVVRASDPASRFALSGAETMGRHARADEPVRLLRVDRAKISTLLIWDQTGNEDETATTGGDEARSQITALLMQSRLFEQVPPGNIERIGRVVEPVHVAARETVVRQGDPGDYYYIIQRGRCAVLRERGAGEELRLLAELGKGDTFGEEALLTDSKRNATVRMLEDGVLLRLTREYFADLISAPLLTEVGHQRAEDLVATGARWIDVRLPEEFQRDGLEGAVNIPLGELRSRRRELSTSASYVIYSNTGARAQSGAFLLSQRGMHVCCLRGGIAHRRPRPRGPKHGEDSIALLHAELAKADAELDQALQLKAEADAAREVEARLLEQSAVPSEARAHLDRLTQEAQAAWDTMRGVMERKRDLDARVRDAQALEATRRRTAEAQCLRLRERTRELLDAEKHQLAEHYERASERLQLMEAQRQEAEARFAAEQARIQRELDDARARIELEAARIRQAVENARTEAQRKAQSIRQEHEGHAEQLRRETEDELRAERARLENEFASSMEAQEKARQQLDRAEAARQEAERETQRILDEARAALAARRAEDEQRREAQVEELRNNAEAARKRVELAHQRRDAAGVRHEQLSESLENLAGDPDPQRKAALGEQLASFEQELASADDALDAAREAHAVAEKEQAIAEETVAVARSREDELRVQIYEEMESWISEEEERSREELARSEQFTREFERVQGEKEQRRKEEEVATASMFTEIESMLSGTTDPRLDELLQTRTVAEEKARLIQHARRLASEQTAQARAAVDRNEEHDPPKTD